MTKITTRRTIPTTQEGIEKFFAEYKNSAQIKFLLGKVNAFCGIKLEISKEHMDAFSQEAALIKKEIEKQRAELNDKLNIIKAKNQEIFKPMLEAVATHQKDTNSKYQAEVLRIQREEAERQRILDEQFRIQREEAERQREEAREKAAVDIENGKVPKPVFIPEPMPLEVTRTEFSKKILRKSITAEVDDILSLVKYLLRPGGEIPMRVKEDLLIQMIDLKTQPIVNHIRNNQDQKRLDEIRANGVCVEVFGYDNLR